MAAFPLVNFESSTQIEIEREELRGARRAVLDKAKHAYEKSERRKEKARLAGEGTLMLQSVADRIDKEEKEMEKVKKKKKEKKEKKKKKKHKKEKKKKKHSSSSESDSSEEAGAWVESSTGQADIKPAVGPTLQRDSWMAGPLATDFIPTVTREELRQRKVTEEEKAEKEKVNLLSQPGQHSKELNPYWRDGGTGVPEEKPQSSGSAARVPAASGGDGGLSWLRKSYQNFQQRAKDEGRSLEDVAAERYGSLEKLESMIREAERASGKGPRRPPDQRFHGDNRASSRRSPPPGARPEDDTGKRRDRDGPDRRPYGNNSSRNVGESRGDRGADPRDRQDRDRRDRDRDRQERGRGERERDIGGQERDGEDSRERGRGERERDIGGQERDRENSRERDRKDSRERDRGREDSSRDRGRNFGGRGGRGGGRTFARPRDDSDDDAPTERKRRTFAKPGDDDDGFSHNSRPSDPARSLKGRFAKPADSDEENGVDSRKRDTFRDSGSSSRSYGGGGGGGGGGRGWRKPEAKDSRAERRPSSREEKRRKRSVSSSSDSSSSSSSDSGDEEKREDEEREEPEPEPVKLLTEDEMNSIGAKILRAEMMGDDALAAELKGQLEQARKAKVAAPKAPPVSRDTGNKVKDDEEDVVVLTRTGRDGMVRPLPEQEYDRDRSGRKRNKKMKNVDTHKKGGERTKYFDDDERHDLKTLVQMEKLGTAEDQNAMFARLAGRSVEKTDEDYQVDDVFVSKAAMQQSGARNEEKERSKAVFEHRKVNTAMDKCQFCFNKVPKHLIIAIGTKAYLSLPAHRSLAPGHCLIVPMQHTSAATALDEDVWTEMQTFRKQLVQMFAAQDQDVIFMETSMHLRHFPHTMLECVPLDREICDLGPIYFKKAMLDAGPEWNSNKKVVDLSKKDIRHSVPKGFPYFSVDFGLQGGFAHVIEDEATFPVYFGREIVGGMIDAEPGLWRKPHREQFEEQRKKVLEFEQWWKPYDLNH